MAYPIKYIENNLVFNHDGECFAYYELLPYNYSFLSPEQKYQVHDLLPAAYRPEQGREDSRPANQHRIQHTGGTGTLQTGSNRQVKRRCLCKD